MFSFIHRRAETYNKHIPCHDFILVRALLEAEWIESERDLRELEHSKSKVENRRWENFGLVELVDIIFLSYFLLNSWKLWKLCVV